MHIAAHNPEKVRAKVKNWGESTGTEGRLQKRGSKHYLDEKIAPGGISMLKEGARRGGLRVDGRRGIKRVTQKTISN